MLLSQTAALVKLSILIFLNVCKADDSVRYKRYAHGNTREKEDNGLVKDIETNIVTDALQHINIPVDLMKIAKRSYEQTGYARQKKHVPTYGYLIIDGESDGLSDSGSIHEVELDNPEIVDDESKVLSSRFKREVHSVNYKGYTPTYFGYLRKATASAAGVTSGAPTYMANADTNYTSTKLYHGYRSMRHKRHLLQHTETRNPRSIPFYGYYLRKKGVKENTGVLEAQDGQIVKAETGNPNVANVKETETKNKYLHNYYGVRSKRSPVFYGYYLRKKLDKANTGVLDAQDGQIVEAEAGNPNVANVKETESKNKYLHNYYGVRSKRSPVFYNYYLRKKLDKANTGVIGAQDGQTVNAETGNPKLANVAKTETEKKYIHNYYGIRRSKRSPVFYNYYLRKKLDKANTGVLDAQDGQIVKAEAGNPNVANVAKTETGKKYIHNYYGIRRSKRSPVFYGYYLRKKEGKESTWTMNAQDGQSVGGKAGNSKVENVDKTENKYIHNYNGVRNKRSPVFYYLRKKDDKTNTGVLGAQDGQIAKAAALNPSTANVVETKTNNKYLRNYYGVRNKRSSAVYGYYLRKKLDKANTGVLSAQDGQIISAALLNPSLANVEEPKSKNKHLHSYYGLRIKRSPVSYGYFLRKKEKDENTGFLVAQDGQIVKAVAGNLKFANVKETDSDNKIFQGYRAHRV